MSELVKIELHPLGKVLSIAQGAPLQDALFGQGVEFPCGGRGRCRGCKVKVLTGSMPVSEEEREKLTPAELQQGWRLACRARAQTNVTLELAQWEAPILSDETPFSFRPRAGIGVAIDLGTTTIVAQLLDLQTGNVLAVNTALNEQALHGADVMSRVEYAVRGGQPLLQSIVRNQLRGLVTSLMGSGYKDGLESIVIVGNTVMHHLFCGIDVEPLSRVPFEPLTMATGTFAAEELGWPLGKQTRVWFLPCLGGFVGSDVLAGVLATGMAETEKITALIDLGTNGEIVLGNRRRLLCASTAAGPAFEGARIGMGMRAATGAITSVRREQRSLRCHVLGNGTARGICGSGLVDAVAAALELGLVQSSGRLARGGPLELTPPVSLSQRDIRELQLAKGAIAAGFELLLQKWGAGLEDIGELYLAGAFGNYINLSSGRRIGLLKVPVEKVAPAGNTALLGAKLALFSLPEKGTDYTELRARVEHVSLHEMPEFQERFVAEMAFPEP